MYCVQIPLAVERFGLGGEFGSGGGFGSDGEFGANGGFEPNGGFGAGGEFGVADGLSSRFGADERGARQLSEEVLQRYKRSWLVQGVGVQGQQRLLGSRILIIGVGGLGSPVALYLAAAGVARLGLCDNDEVEIHNLQRQVLYTEADVGMKKSVRAGERLRELNASVVCESLGEVTAQMLASQRGRWDLVIECSDNFATKFAVADWCAAEGVPLVWGSVVGMQFQVSVFWSRPGVDGQGRQVPVTCLRDVFPVPPAEGTTPSSRKVGVLGPVVGVCASLMATEAVKVITGCAPALIGEILSVDVRNMRFHTIPFRGQSDLGEEREIAGERKENGNGGA